MVIVHRGVETVWAGQAAVLLLGEGIGPSAVEMLVVVRVVGILQVEFGAGCTP